MLVSYGLALREIYRMCILCAHCALVSEFTHRHVVAPESLFGHLARSLFFSSSIEHIVKVNHAVSHFGLDPPRRMNVPINCSTFVRQENLELSWHKATQYVYIKGSERGSSVSSLSSNTRCRHVIIYSISITLQTVIFLVQKLELTLRSELENNNPLCTNDASQL